VKGPGSTPRVFLFLAGPSLLTAWLQLDDGRGDHRKMLPPEDTMIHWRPQEWQALRRLPLAWSTFGTQGHTALARAPRGCSSHLSVESYHLQMEPDARTWNPS
jgi:hypothetical protein